MVPPSSCSLVVEANTRAQLSCADANTPLSLCENTSSSWYEKTKKDMVYAWGAEQLKEMKQLFFLNKTIAVASYLMKRSVRKKRFPVQRVG